MNKNNPIGIFDSGVGGLSVANCIRTELPHEDLLYVADSAYAPYGNQTQTFIEQRSIILTEYLLAQRAKAIVVACNTATVSAIKTLRKMFTIPIIGVEPGVKPAALSSKSGVIGILATEQTLKSYSFNFLAERFASDVKVEVQACSGLVEQIEKMDLEGDKTFALLQRYLQPLLDKNVDTLVLGCTHYAFLLPMIQKVVGDEIDIINTGAAVARETARRLETASLLNTNNRQGIETFWTSGDVTSVTKAISQLWGSTVKVSLMQEGQRN
ncbi:MAG: glutamate racemase [Gammaproteobacteria bacterium]|nr:glutamate racemase [Gammaproteobacteria bacterium]